MKGFMGSSYIPKRGSEESKAISKLKGMKVYKVMTHDSYYETFTDVWYAVAHEVDMYEAYDTQHDYNEWFGGSDGLQYGSYNRAKKWLDETKHLTKDEW